MTISPIPSSGSSQPTNFESPLMQKFYNEWTAWYNNPTKETGTTLLHFLKENQTHLDAIGSKFPCPFGPKYTENFQDTLSNAINILQEWTEAPNSNITSPISELIANVYDWVNQAGGGGHGRSHR